jgi:pyruvate dehydrogenase E1 component alpha subunit
MSETPVPAVARGLLHQMMRIRVAEETIACRYTGERMRCPTHLCTGQEAVPAGVGAVLRREDFAVGTHRSHGHYLAKGGDLKRMLAEIYGKATGCSGGKGGSMHLVDEAAGFMGSTSIVGGTIPVGTGLGLAISLRGTDAVSCVFLGDAATEEGVFYESVNFALLKKLPVLYVCENNLYSVYSPLRVRQPAGRRLAEMVGCMGVWSESGDGNDVFDVYERTARAAARLRAGAGPAFLEFATYRWREHCGPHFDNDIGYRTEEEYLAWKGRDPIVALEERLLREGVVDAAGIRELGAAVAREVEEAFAFAEASPFPDAAEALAQVYAAGGEGGEP